MATEFTDYRGYRLATTSPKEDDKWTVMINPIEALRALAERAEGETRDIAIEAARRIVDASLEPRPEPRGFFGWLGASRGTGSRRTSF